MAGDDREASLAELLGRLASDVPDLLRHEMRLAQTELRAAADAFGSAAIGVAVAALLTVAATGLLVAALVAGLAFLLAAVGVDPTLAQALSALSLSALVGVAAWLAVRQAMIAVRQAKTALETRARGVAADIALVTERI